MLGRFHPIGNLLVLVATWLPTSPSLAADAKAGSSVSDEAGQDLILFGPLRPVMIRLHLYVDGRPFRQTWRDHSRQRFESLDHNHNGQIDIDEAKNARPSLAALSAGGRAQGDAALVRFVTGLTRPATIEECLAWQEVSADGPFSVTESAAAALSDGALLDLIDRDRDRRLARAEIESAIDVLRRRDFDNNEVLSRNELISGAALYQSVVAEELLPDGKMEIKPDSQSSAVEPGMNQDPAVQEDRGQFVFVIHPSATPAQIAGALLGRYDRDRNGQLTQALERREIALPAQLFTQLDANHDSGLDAGELEQFAGMSPAVELVFQFGRLSSEVSQVATNMTSAENGEMDDDPSKPGAIRVRERSDGSYKLELPDALVDLRRDNRHPTKNRSQEISFRSFDSDGNKYLDTNEAARVIGKAPLALIDADANAMVSEPEFEEFVTREGDAAGARLVLALTGEGQNLFDQIDANFDGGLTARELRTAGQQLAALDQNGDGYLDGDELPQQVGLVLARGRLRLPSAADAASMRRPRGAVRVEEEVGPNWFRKMDRNRDGDVSPREFLGSTKVFEQLDANRDGLIDAVEAEKAPGK